MKDKNLYKTGKGKLVLRCDKLLICGGEYGGIREEQSSLIKVKNK
jgi:hypothetical protein